MWIYVITRLIQLVFQLYLLALILRAVLSWVPIIKPDWRPTNAVLIHGLNFIYKITDPPLRLASRFFKPIQMGGLGIDISFIIVFLLVMVLSRLVLRGWITVVSLWLS